MKKQSEIDALRPLAQHLAPFFAGIPNFGRFRISASPVKTIDILTTRHEGGVSYLGTLGCSLVPNGKNGPMARGKKPIRIELITAIKEEFEDAIVETLGNLRLALEVADGGFSPGSLVQGVLPEGFPMKHAYLCDPFLWDEGLPSKDMGDYFVAFLHLLPISDRERTAALKTTPKKFEEVLAKKNVQYFDLNRASVF